MSKQALFSISIGLIVLAAAFFFFKNNKTDQQGVTKTEEAEIMLFIERGDVSYKTAAMQTFVKATSSPTVISNNTQVHTGIGVATILFPNNGSVTLDEYTELNVVYSEKEVTLFQTLGSTYHRVEALVTGSTYHVETPGTLAAVRGTRFAVKYDKKTKKTKVAVTENNVEVSKFVQDASTSTKRILQSQLVGVGKTAQVDSQATSTATSSRSFLVVDTSTDNEMKPWLDTNKNRDAALERFKSSNMNREQLRNELREMFLNRNVDTAFPGTQEVTKPTTNVNTTTNTTTNTTNTTNTTTVLPKTTTNTTTTNTTSTTTVVIKKIDPEIFFDKFNALYFNHFYLDEQDLACTIKATPLERVRIITSYANASGYPFVSATMSGFAEAVVGYCANKDPIVKTKLQARFDVEFPYPEEI